MQRIAALLALTTSLACGGPVGPFPGGRLAGEQRPFPIGGFGFAADEERVAVEVGRDAPRSVHTWAVVVEGSLFVPADFFHPGKQWPHLAAADPRARIRVAEIVYPCLLTRVEAPQPIERLREAAAAKYQISPDSWAARVEVWWFRVDPPQESSPAAKRVQPTR